MNISDFPKKHRGYEIIAEAVFDEDFDSYYRVFFARQNQLSFSGSDTPLKELEDKVKQDIDEDIRQRWSQRIKRRSAGLKFMVNWIKK